MYTPRFVSQFDGSRLQRANCTMAAGAMLLDKQTNGRLRVSGGDLRAAQTDQDTAAGDRPGTTLGAVGAAFRSYGQDLQRTSLPTVAALRSVSISGRGVVLQGSYARFSLAYRIQKSFTGGHSIYVDHAVTRSDGVWYWRMDPLGRSPYVGDYVPEREIARFGWCLGFWGSAAVAGPSTGGDGPTPTPTGTTAGTPETEQRTVKLRPIALSLQVKGSDGNMHNATAADIFTATRADQWAQIVYEMQGGHTNIDATQPDAEGRTFDNLASIRSAATPYVGKRIGDLPDTVEITVRKPVGGWIDQLLAGLGNMAFSGTGAIFGLAMLFVAVWRLSRD